MNSEETTNNDSIGFDEMLQLIKHKDINRKFRLSHIVSNIQHHGIEIKEENLQYLDDTQPYIVLIVKTQPGTSLIKLVDKNISRYISKLVNGAYSNEKDSFSLIGVFTGSDEFPMDKRTAVLLLDLIDSPILKVKRKNKTNTPDISEEYRPLSVSLTETFVRWIKSARGAFSGD